VKRASASCPLNLTLGAFRSRLRGFWKERDEGLHPRLDFLNSLQARVNQFDRRYARVPDRARSVRNR
jgi:hypothetical protein